MLYIFHHKQAKVFTYAIGYAIIISQTYMALNELSILKCTVYSI